ncbi:hypothetical protein KUV59_07780 [Marinobacter daepoensis]|uniref:hypothetical protein n=1 Tax=Marinobacter daepoensis TaxID=262077 RepID=UPI001C97C501|nr:hypothetical protein [Marinobacter daepoensis]MBY6033064.1 hypothetical protein [Marinobacter daepoensis]
MLSSMGNFIADVLLPIIEANGIVFSALLAAFAYAYRTSVETKKATRHALYLLIQVRVALNAVVYDFRSQLGGTIDLQMDRFGEFGIDVTDEEKQVNKDEAEKYGTSLEESFFRLDGTGFSEAVRTATTELSKIDPIMANRISFISRLPSAIDAQKDYVQRIEASFLENADSNSPKHVIENTRTVCQKHLGFMCEKVNRALLDEVDAVLIELAKKSGLLHRFKVKSLIKKWDMPDSPEDLLGSSEDFSKLMMEIVTEIAALNRKSEESRTDGESAKHA